MNKTPRAEKSICEKCLWESLSPTQIESLKSCQGSTALIDLLRSFGYSVQTDLFAEVVNAVLLFAKNERLSRQQLAVLIAIIYEILKACAADPYGRIDESLTLAHDLMLSHSVQRPPNSIEIFPIHMSRSCMKFIVDHIYCHWKMYKYNLAPTVQLVPYFAYEDSETEIKKVEPKTSGRDVLLRIICEAMQDQLNCMSIQKELGISYKQ
ncbi:unnamed protein product [Calicophoron daubneyi]|uniref:Uncharacterized protein n=1 Tax=Calicophoron daubneyi TaxID=300641 RepID=A0AAV2T6A0_CALDB